MSALPYIHVDVFSDRPFRGNSLTVFPDARGLPAAQMLAITQEMRHFESIFLEPTEEPGTVRARVFDLFEELPFAGHPLLGAAAVLHRASGRAQAHTWRFALSGKSVGVRVQPTERGWTTLLDQGPPEFLGRVEGLNGAIAAAFSLEAEDFHPVLPLEVVSTGLAYLVVPLRPGAIARARVAHDLTALLRRAGAQFAVLLDEAALEVRHWNNDGVIEDVATGSAAGTLGAYRLRHGLARGGETFHLQQGRFTGRPSTLRVQPEGTPEHVRTVQVGGDVAFVGHGVLEAWP